MSDIRPFRGIRPLPSLAPRVAAPPYDTVDYDEGRAYVEGNPDSFLRVEKSEIELPRDLPMHDRAIFENGARNLKRLLDEGKMIRDESPCFYLYRQVMGDHAQVGIVAGASVAEYQADLIKKHEYTRPDKEKERTLHVDIVGANTGPVFLTYPAQPDIDAFVAELTRREPDVDFTAEDGIVHTLWVVSAPGDVDRLRSLFRNVPALYVADGHHRSAAASNVQKSRARANPNHTGNEPYNFFLAVVFPDNLMKIMAYNRVVLDLNGHTPEGLKEAISRSFEIENTDEPNPPRPTQFGMYLDGTWYRLTARAGSFDPADPVASLDVAILQDNLLHPILGIQDPRTDKRIQFVGGIRGTAELENRARKTGGVAFAMYPTSIDQLMAIADAGKVMPPKSTWFEPKLRSGMVVKSIND